jgi:hypothetical protein
MCVVVFAGKLLRRLRKRLEDNIISRRMRIAGRGKKKIYTDIQQVTFRDDAEKKNVILLKLVLEKYVALK